MKSREIIKQLEKLGKDVDVKYIYDYGDRWKIAYELEGVQFMEGCASDTDTDTDTDTDDFDEAFEDIFDDSVFDHDCG